MNWTQDSSDEVLSLLSPLYNLGNNSETGYVPHPKVSKGTIACLKGQHLRAMDLWKSELAETSTTKAQIRLVHMMLYSILESTGNLDDISELLNWTESAVDSNALEVLEHSVANIFISFLIRGSAIIPASYNGSAIKENTFIKGGLEDNNVIPLTSLQPAENHFLHRPQTFIKILLFRKKVANSIKINLLVKVLNATSSTWMDCTEKYSLVCRFNPWHNLFCFSKIKSSLSLNFFVIKFNSREIICQVCNLIACCFWLLWQLW